MTLIKSTNAHQMIHGQTNVVYQSSVPNSATERNEVLTHGTTWVNFENIVLSEISRIQKIQKTCIIMST